MKQSTFANMKKGIRSFVYYMFVKVANWIPANWRIRITHYKDARLEEYLVYKSHCWSCQADIESEKQFYKYGMLIVPEWLGAKKCKLPGCNYFICPVCGMCLHNLPSFDFNSPLKPRATMYVRLDSKRFGPTRYKVYERTVSDLYLDRLYEMKKHARSFFGANKP